MLCNYMHSWYFSYSISAVASGTGGYTCGRGCKIQHPSLPSRRLSSICSLVLLKTDSLILCSSSYPPSFPAFTAALFFLPALQNYCQVVGACSWAISAYSCQNCLFLISCRCSSQFRLYTVHYKCVDTGKSTSLSTEIFPMLMISNLLMISCIWTPKEIENK